MQGETCSDYETELFKHIAAASGDARGEFWGMTDLAKSWFGPSYVHFALMRKRLADKLHTLAADIHYAFRPNGQAWWWLTACGAVLVTVWVYTR